MVLIYKTIYRQYKSLRLNWLDGLGVNSELM